MQAEAEAAAKANVEVVEAPATQEQLDKLANGEQEQDVAEADAE